MTGVRARARLQPMVMVFHRRAGMLLWIRQIGDGVPNRKPPVLRRRAVHAHSPCLAPGAVRPVALGNLVEIPVNIVAPLAPKERILRMCFLWKMPFDGLVGTKAHDKHPLAALGHAEIGGVQDALHNMIVQALIAPARFMIFKTCKMIRPRLVPFGLELGVP